MPRGCRRRADPSPRLRARSQQVTAHADQTPAAPTPHVFEPGRSPTVAYPECSSVRQEVPPLSLCVLLPRQSAQTPLHSAAFLRSGLHRSGFATFFAGGCCVTFVAQSPFPKPKDVEG